MPLPPDARRYRANWQGELDSANVYRAMAEAERDPRLAEVYRRLAAVEESHLAFWEAKLRDAGARVPPRRPAWRSRTLAFLARRYGTSGLLPTLVSLERIDSTGYDRQPESARSKLPMQERSHARLLRAIQPGTGLSGGVLAQLEGRHRGSSGNALRAAVLGANDGLISNLNLVMGVAGAALSGRAVLVTGLAGLLAGAFSMALGEWLSVQSARELAERQLSTERTELAEVPDEEEEELALIYQAKGLPEPQARSLAHELIANKSTALDTLAREELGIDPHELGGSSWEAALTSFVLFSVGAIIPVVPFFFASGAEAIALSLALSAVALFVSGALSTLFTGRGVLRTGARQVAFGLAAAAVTFGLGKLLGVAVNP